MFHALFYYIVQTMLSFRSLLTLPTFSFSASRQGQQSVEFTHEVENNLNSTVSPAEAEFFQNWSSKFSFSLLIQVCKIQYVFPQFEKYADCFISSNCQSKSKDLLEYDLLPVSFLVQSTGSVEKTFGQEESIPLVLPPIPTHPTVHIHSSLFLFLKKHISTNVIGFCFPSK